MNWKLLSTSVLGSMAFDQDKDLESRRFSSSILPACAKSHRIIAGAVDEDGRERQLVS